MIEKVDKYKYLGVVFDEHLTYNGCAEVLAEAGSRALGALFNKVVSMKGIGFKAFTKLYNSCVDPILCYGAEVWGF